MTCRPLYFTLLRATGMALLYAAAMPVLATSAAECARLADDHARLACYDDAFANTKSEAAPLAGPAKMPPAPGATTPSTASPGAAAKAVTSATVGALTGQRDNIAKPPPTPA